MKLRKIIDIAFIVLMLTFIVLIGIIYLELRKDGSQCIQNPLEYITGRNPDLTCNCYSTKDLRDLTRG